MKGRRLANLTGVTGGLVPRKVSANARPLGLQDANRNNRNSIGSNAPLTPLPLPWAAGHPGQKNMLKVPQRVSVMPPQQKWDLIAAPWLYLNLLAAG